MNDMKILKRQKRVINMLVETIYRERLAQFCAKLLVFSMAAHQTAKQLCIICGTLLPLTTLQNTTFHFDPSNCQILTSHCYCIHFTFSHSSTPKKKKLNWWEICPKPFKWWLTIILHKFLLNLNYSNCLMKNSLL